MIRIKFEVEEEEEVTPIENENDRIKRLLSLKFFGNNNNSNNFGGGSTTSDINNVFRTLKELPLKLLENNVVPKNVVPKEKKKPKLDNSKTDSVAFVGSKSIKTEPVESSLSLTTQLNNSLNIQSLLTQNRIQNGWTTNEQSIPIGTQQQQSVLLPKIEPIVSEIHQEVPLSLDQCFSISNSNSMETTTTATNCDITTTELFPGLRASLGRRAKLNVCYSVPKKPKPEVPRRMKKVPDTPPTLPKEKCGEYQREQQWKTQNLRNLAAVQNSESNQHSISGTGLISGFDPTSESSSSSTGPPSLPPEAAVPLLVGKKPLPLRVPPLTLEEKRKALNRERSLRYYYRNKSIPKKPLDPEVKAEKLRRKREYRKKFRQQLLATGTPEQLELVRLKDKQRFKRFMEKESEEQRQRRLERVKRRKELQWNTMTPEEREKKRALYREYNYRYRNRKLMMKKSLEELQTSISSTS